MQHADGKRARVHVGVHVRALALACGRRGVRADGMSAGEGVRTDLGRDDLAELAERLLHHVHPKVVRVPTFGVVL